MKREEINIRDPFVLTRNGQYYLYGTRGATCWGPADGFDVYVSRDLENWDGPFECFHNDGTFWADRNYWAPEVHEYHGKLYMLASFKREDLCRGTAILTADDPLGPFVPHSDGRVTPSNWECLDGTLYVSPDDKPYLVFAHEWVQVGDGEICAMPLSDDLSRAIGERLTCVYVDHGFMRKNETESVREVFTNQFPVNLVIVDARDRFLTKLAGVSDPETKRKLIGGEFVYCFADGAKKLEGVEFLAQGTIYPDVIESGSVKGSAVIKSHHNVGGLPADVRAKFTGGLVEPLRMLFKDEVRKVGEELSMPHDMVWRQPFPGPGLAIRIMGDITADKLETVRESDAILREEVALAGLERDVNQYFTVLTNTRTVGVMGDERTHDFVLAIRAVTTDDFMTVDWARLPYDLLAKVSARIVNEVPRVNRVVYDITTKPPATVEWE